MMPPATCPCLATMAYRRSQRTLSRSLSSYFQTTHHVFGKSNSVHTLSLMTRPPLSCHHQHTLKNRRQSAIHSTPSAAKKDPLLESFNRTDDYDYGLQYLSGGSSFSVNLTATGFTWPEVHPDADTAFLEINLTDTHHIDEIPAIKVNGAGIDTIQYFEQGGSGRRYLDLGPLLAAGVRAGASIQLGNNSGASWKLGQTTLTTFTNPSIKGRRVLVLSPHPDDAEIAAYGLYTSSNADIVTITAGDAGKAKFGNLWSDSGEHYRAKGRIRTIDSLAVPLLGRLRPDAIRNLGYYDGTLTQLWTDRPNIVEPKLAVLEEPGYFRQFNFSDELRNRPFESNWNNLVADLLLELETVRPEIIVVPHPFMDRHIDHQYTAIALFEALFQWGEECDIYLYTNHAVGNESYPLGPRNGVLGLPAYNGKDLHLTGLYSHQLHEEDRRQKLVALEAMHDLRPFDLRDGSHVVELPKIYDYFRRAGRPNEVFFVTNNDGAERIHQEFVAKNSMN